MPILDQFGKPIEFKTEPSVRAEATGVRKAAYGAVARGMTPGRMASILDGAVNGNIQDYLSMAEEMEERYLHYFGVLSDRKLAITGAPITVLPADESEGAGEVAAAFEECVIETEVFENAKMDLLDGLGKSFGVVEPVWDTKTKPWTYLSLDGVDPRWFQFEKVGMKELRLRDDNSDEGTPLDGGQFIIHRPKIKSGITIRCGLARLAAIAFMAHTYTVKDWLAFMEVYGMPIRLGKYDPNVIKEPERLTLRMALANIGHDAAAMIPEGMDIDIIDVSRGGNASALFKEKAEYWDKQVSKGVLGQTMTTDDGSSLAQAKIHNEVRQDIKEADARGLEATINKGIARPWAQINFGENAPIPRVSIAVAPPEDLKVFTESALPWVERGGLRVGAGYIRDKFGIPDPEDEGETEILGGGAYEVQGPDAAGQGPGNEQITGLNFVRHSFETDKQYIARLEKALNFTAPKDVRTVEDMAEDYIAQWRRVMSPYEKAVVTLAERAQNYTEFKNGLEDLELEFDSDPFAKSLAEACFKARGVGNTEGK